MKTGSTRDVAGRVARAAGLMGMVAVSLLPSGAMAGIGALPGRALVPTLSVADLATGPGLGDPFGGTVPQKNGIIPVTSPCPEDLLQAPSSFESGDADIDDDERPQFAGTEAPAEVLKATQEIMAEAQVILASCNDAPQRDPVSVTRTLDREVAQVNETCSQLQIQYRIYCLANQYDALAQQLPQGGQYHEMRTILKDTAGKLRSLGEQNIDTAAEEVRPTGVDRRAPSIGRAPLPAVRTDNVEATLAAATVILQDAQVLLIRSVEESEARFAAYQTVSAGLDNSMLLLRS